MNMCVCVSVFVTTSLPARSGEVTTISVQAGRQDVFDEAVGLI